MNLVVDTNIVFSGILSPKEIICDLLLNSSDNFEFFPSAIFDELNYRKDRPVETNPLSTEKPLHPYELEVDWMSYKPFYIGSN
ncbi:PIN domain-containing protein [Pararhodonellum marinum]|uniref:hypothetical protein n=1 Tax=Pararhodonellum marinum TaxID=2755358 RepID=UPI0018900D73|nr:hypothetical protein [Pararhodonellum marinum]